MPPSEYHELRSLLLELKDAVCGSTDGTKPGLRQHADENTRRIATLENKVTAYEGAFMFVTKIVATAIIVAGIAVTGFVVKSYLARTPLAPATNSTVNTTTTNNAAPAAASHP